MRALINTGESRSSSFSEFIGNSPKMKRVFALIEQLLDNNSTVLILGESGTGKEMAAKAIHYYGDRKNNPLITVNCGAIPEELLESELFGHEKGAFTGAIRTRLGKFEMADKGTIFLDEIGDMSPVLQVKMLRVLQEQEFDRVGGDKSVKVDVRIIAATNKDLDKSVADGKFREDLYYRLNVIPLLLPPLRERKEDIVPLTNHFISKFNKSKKRNINGITEEVMKCLMSYEWKGNIRELENIIERAVILKRNGYITIQDLPEKISGITTSEPEEFNEYDICMDVPISSCDIPEINRLLTSEVVLPDEGINLKEVVENFENSLILQAMEKANWVKGKAADLLGLNRTTLVEKLKKKGIRES